MLCFAVAWYHRILTLVIASEKNPWILPNKEHQSDNKWSYNHTKAAKFLYSFGNSACNENKLHISGCNLVIQTANTMKMTNVQWFYLESRASAAYSQSNIYQFIGIRLGIAIGIRLVNPKLKWNINRISWICIHENASEYVVGKMAAILCRLQCVKPGANTKSSSVTNYKFGIVDIFIPCWYNEIICIFLMRLRIIIEETNMNQLSILLVWLLLLKSGLETDREKYYMMAIQRWRFTITHLSQIWVHFQLHVYDKNNISMDLQWNIFLKFVSVIS